MAEGTFFGWKVRDEFRETARVPDHRGAYRPWQGDGLFILKAMGERILSVVMIYRKSLVIP